jgi:hypothetical protein
MIKNDKENFKNAIKQLIFNYQYDIIKINIDCKKSENSIQVRILLEDRI